MANRILRGLAVGALAIVATACTARLDVPGLEARLRQELRARYDTTFTVACPDDIEVGRGNDFECTADGEDGTTLTLRMTQVDDQASVTYEIVEG